MLRATTTCTFSTSQLPKVARTWCALYILTWKCASRHNHVHFFDISTSKSGPDLVCFVHFDLEMCFAPQPRALFRHLNFQKWSEREVSLAFLLTNVLRATTACNFSSLVWLAGSRTRHFSEVTFRPSGAPNHWKNSDSRLSYLFAHLHLLASRLFSSLIFSLLDFSSLTLPTYAFPSAYCRKFDFQTSFGQVDLIYRNLSVSSAKSVGYVPFIYLTYPIHLTDILVHLLSYTIYVSLYEFYLTYLTYLFHLHQSDPVRLRM